MNKLFLLLLVSSYSLGMLPTEPVKHQFKKIGNMNFTGHVQDQMVKREISVISVLTALSKGVYAKESDDIDLCVYMPEALTVVIANKKTIVTAWRDKSLTSCQKKLKLMFDLKGDTPTVEVFAKIKNMKFKFSEEAEKRMKRYHMTSAYVTLIVKEGLSYPTYSGSKLFVRYPYAALYKDGTITKIFSGLKKDKVKEWIRQRNLVMSTDCPKYASNHQMTAKSVRKQIKKTNMNLMSDDDEDGSYYDDAND